jgi:branched-chain amino acid transport system ATP-binding protein
LPEGHTPQDAGRNPSPPFRGEREGPAQREGEVGGAAVRYVGSAHPTLSPRLAGGEDNKAGAGSPLLEFRGVDTYYGDLHVLKSVDYRIAAGEIVCLLGGNASGKSTTMKAVMGSVVPRRGDILYEGGSLAGVSTAERVRRGIAPVLEARRLFPRMTVLENLEMGAYTRRRGPEFDEDLARVFALFPRVEERLHQLAGTLSGGEQQMVAIGRALMARPKLLCMDEPSMGLSPAYVEQVFDIIRTINRQGVTIFMVEQNANMALQLADRAYVLQTGQVVLSGAAAELRENELIRHAYLGELKVA